MDGLMEYNDQENESEDKDSEDDFDILVEARDKFKLASESEDENREAALDDIRFARLSEQWPDDIKSQREAEGRPCLTINKLPAYIRQVVNDARQNKPAIRTRPVDDNADPDTAKILSGLIRNIEYSSNADVAYDTGIDSAITSGYGYWRVNIDYAHDDTFDLDILIERIANPFSVYGDPYSTAADSSDWNCAFVVERMQKKEFERKYKDSEPVNWDEDGDYSELSAPWVDDETVLIAEYWTREEHDREICLLSDGSVVDEDVYEEQQDFYLAQGIQKVDQRTTKSWKVKQRLMTGAEILETNEWPGKYIPIIPVYGDEVNVEGKRYFRSLIRDAKDPQRNFNFWRTASTELVALAPKAPFIGKKGTFNSDSRKWSTANTKSHAYIEYDGNEPPQRQPFAGVPAGALQEALNSSDDLKAVTGIFDASMGAQGNETSGKAIIARQREGDTSTFHFMDNLNRAIRHTGRVIIDLIPHIYSGERVIRILGEDGKEAENIPLGRQTEYEGMERIFDLSVGKYDVTVDTGPSFNTKREESATQMLELIRVYPQAAPLIADLLASNLDWPGADEIAERFRAVLPPQIQGQNPEMQQLQQQAQQAIQQLQQQLSQVTQESESLKNDKSIDAEKLKIDAYKAETDRIKVTQPIMSPEQIQQLVVQTVQGLVTQPDISPPEKQQQPLEPPSGGFFSPEQITNPTE